MLNTNGTGAEGAMTYPAAQNDLNLQRKKLAHEQAEIRLKNSPATGLRCLGLPW